MTCRIVKKMEEIHQDTGISVTEHNSFKSYMEELLEAATIEMLEELKDSFTLESYRQLARNEIKKRRGRCVI